MRLMKTSSLWGNIYRNRYYLNGKRITDTHASYLFKNHAWEDAGFDREGGVYRSYWDIGPRLELQCLWEERSLSYP